MHSFIPAFNISVQGYGTPFPLQSIVTLIVWFICLMYASIRSSSNSSLGKITGGDESIQLSASREPINSQGSSRAA